MKFICNDCSKLMGPEETVVGSFEGELTFLCRDCLSEINDGDEEEDLE